jgi:hypothetical protein
MAMESKTVLSVAQEDHSPTTPSPPKTAFRESKMIFHENKVDTSKSIGIKTTLEHQPSEQSKVISRQKVCMELF